MFSFVVVFVFPLYLYFSFWSSGSGLKWRASSDPASASEGGRSRPETPQGDTQVSLQPSPACESRFQRIQGYTQVSLQPVRESRFRETLCHPEFNLVWTYVEAPEGMDQFLPLKFYRDTCVSVHFQEVFLFGT